MTGAASGIGRATALRLLGAGWRVCAADLDADRVRAALTAYEGSAALQAQAADISSPEDVQALYRAADAAFGGLDGVANVAGVSFLEDQRIEDVDVETFDRTHAVNLRGTFLMCKYAIDPLRRRGGGAIVNLGSVASVRGVGGPAYVSSKAGIAGLSRAIAASYAADLIRCNTVAPGPTSTPMLEISKRKSTVTTLGAAGTIPGEADPDEIAALVHFLLGPTGRFMTGGIYTLDGGISQH
ncbi:SDR family oxidoreductase [Dactylosporangium salmoneum]|uniref:SDR family NAD(P)-dependent oxidoreductase n=1 Tax=Dactylosporangium salmoneum TaxID=53361 RepID=UPI0031D3E071